MEEQTAPGADGLAAAHAVDAALDGASDAALARRIAAAAPGVDRAAEAVLCRRLAPRLRLYALSQLRNRSAAADLAQEVLLMTLERVRAGRLRDPERLGAFVLALCRNVMLGQQRAQARREDLLVRYGEVLAPAQAAGPAPDRARLLACLERLGERERAVLVLSFFDERNAEQVGEELGLSAANVRVIRHRGIVRLRNCVLGVVRQ